MPPVNEIVGSLENNIKVADPGELVFLLEKRDQASLVMFRGMSKWVPESHTRWVT